MHFLPDEIIKTKREVKLKKSVIPSQFFVECIEQTESEEQNHDRCDNCEALNLKIQTIEAVAMVKQSQFEIERFKLLDVITKLKNDKMKNSDHIKKLNVNIKTLNGRNVFLEKTNANLKAHLLHSERNSENNNVSKFLNNGIPQHIKYEKLFKISG